MFRILFLLCTLVWIAACTPVDKDQDGWFDKAKNQRATLMVTGISPGPLAPAVTIGDRIVVEGGLNTPTTVPVQVRTLGKWAGDPAEGSQTFPTSIRVDNVPGVINWANEDKDFEVTVGQRITSLRSRLERFADPDKENADADADGDFITDQQEARLAQAAKGRIGDPEARDLLVVSAVTNQIHAMSQRARQAVSTVFRNRGINLVIMDGTQPITGFTAGQFLQNGTTVPDPGFQPFRSDLPPDRPNHIPDWADSFTHFLVMADRARIGEKVYFGAARKPGFELIVGAAFPGLGADGLDYQAKTLMHELGHNLGLCHPVTDDDPNCPDLPQADQDPAVTVMGAPIEADNFVLTVTQALARPLDYTEAQWDAIIFDGTF